MNQGIKSYLSLCDKNILIKGLVFYVIFLELCLALNLLFIDKPFFSIVIWGLGGISVFFTTIKSKKKYKNVKTIIDFLNNFPEYKEISDNLFIGFINYGKNIPGRGYSPKKKTYEKGFSDFIKLDLRNTDEKIQKIQRDCRITILFQMISIASVSAFFLQIFVYIFTSFTY